MGGLLKHALGEVELDASIMDGTTRASGAVAALKGYAHPISVARSIMDRLPQHVFLAADGAARFAAEVGCTPMELLTEPSKRSWLGKLEEIRRAGHPTDWIAANHNPDDQLGRDASLIALARFAQDPAHCAGTVNFIARDVHGHIATAVSTSGWAYKYPGRVGDSCVIGAGNYCDDRFGACTCTGIGEWSIRAGLARSVVSGIEFGLALKVSCERALQDLQSIPLPSYVRPAMNLVAIDSGGNHAAWSVSTHEDFYATYLWQTDSMPSFETSPCRLVATY